MKTAYDIAIVPAALIIGALAMHWFGQLVGGIVTLVATLGLCFIGSYIK